jgi:hypothetical protein
MWNLQQTELTILTILSIERHTNAQNTTFSGHTHQQPCLRSAKAGFMHSATRPVSSVTKQAVVAGPQSSKPHVNQYDMLFTSNSMPLQHTTCIPHIHGHCRQTPSLLLPQHPYRVPRWGLTNSLFLSNMALQRQHSSSQHCQSVAHNSARAVTHLCLGTAAGTRLPPTTNWTTRSRNFRVGVATGKAQVEVCQQHVTSMVQKDVLWLEVPIYVAQQVQVLQSQQNLSSIEPGGCKAAMRSSQPQQCVCLLGCQQCCLPGMRAIEQSCRTISTTRL